MGHYSAHPVDCLPSSYYLHFSFNSCKASNHMHDQPERRNKVTWREKARETFTEIDPPDSDPDAKRRYLWVRNVNGKTVAVPLSKRQYRAIVDRIRG